MKILYHHRTRSSDGQYVHIQELVGALREQGHSVIVVGPDDRLDRRMDAGAGNAGGLLGRLPRWLYELAETGYSLISFLKLLRAYRKHRPDAFYERYNLFSLSGVALRWITGLPMALEINAPLYEERDANGGLALRRLARLTERLSLIHISEPTRP